MEEDYGYHGRNVLTELYGKRVYLNCFCTNYSAPGKGWGQCDLYSPDMITYTNNKPNL